MELRKAMAHKDRILIVDDEQINLEFFEVMLSRLGFIVDKAEDGEQAIELIEKHKPDLIILDNIMPRLSGWELTRLLKQDERFDAYKTIPIIMFSAMDDLKDKIEGFELGVEDYITKPFNFSEVLARIKAVLRNKDLSQQIKNRENRLSVIENLNKSLVFFASHVKNPVSEIFSRAKLIDLNDTKAMEVFIRQVVDECETTLATIEGLEEQIQEMQSKVDEMQGSEISLEGLEEKYQKHFKSYRDREKAVQGV